MKNPESLYIHIPFCKRKCPYCGFYSSANDAQSIPQYLQALHRELERQPREQPMRTIYIGGGTPTALSAEQLRTLLATVNELVERRPDCEFTIEANPGTVDAHKAAVLAEAGVNRVSIGAQSFDRQILHSLGRIHGPEEIHGAVELFRRHGIANISIDLIYAVPGQSAAQLEHDLRYAMELDVQHVSAYGLTIDEGTFFEQAVKTGFFTVADEDVYIEQYDLARQFLAERGYSHYEISNHARPGFESRHNCNYWLNRPYLGVGASATGFVDGTRSTNVSGVREYIEMIDTAGSASVFSEKLSAEDFARETAAFNIRYLPGIDRTSFAERTGYNLEELFADMIESYTQQGLLEYDGQTLKLTPPALHVADSISADFLE